MTDQPLEQVVIEWDSGEQFLEHFQDGDPATLRSPTEVRTDLKPGDLCSLVLRLADRNTDFQLHATLHAESESSTEFKLLAEERMRLELVLISARGESLPYRRRRQTRIPLQENVTVIAEGIDPVNGRTFNVGAGGLQIALDEPFDLETKVTVVIALPRALSLELVGRISGRIDKGPERGNSIEFLFRTTTEREELKALVDRIVAEANDAW